ncbi:adenosylcobinamide-GDP ribazoletransferase [Psychromonas hadalis]|uniref:adenosylcobinamide-GDP ribazoletransferase n=1 Tax=Psychromonas hadalis TaxID=211669 RepID=UPI0003B41707|nr:adenosylcobinamide-GDP ribazoletransferase [Psychromonas hadalis]
MKKLKQQLIFFFYALSYFTRLPTPHWVIFDNRQFHKANAYFPMIGAIVALLMVSFFYLCQLLFPIPISVILILISSLLLTGALHEDGFADCCDGFGGGYDASQRLKIMKDSQIGSYGGIGLIMLFLLKFNLLIALADVGLATFFMVLLIGQVLSRYGALCLMQTMHYVRLENGGKVQGLSTKLNRSYFLFASLSILPALLFFPVLTACLLIMVVTLITYLLRCLFMKNLGGYTGDCLGFAQQTLEVVIFLLLIVMLTT